MRRSTRLMLRTSLLRIFFWLLLPMLLLLALRLFWGWQADRHLARTRSELLAQGIRLHPPTVSVPDDQNAALAVIHAIAAIQLDPSERPLIYGGDGSRSFITNIVWPDRIRGGTYPDISWTDAHKPEVRRILAKNMDAFNWMKIASQRQSARWPTTAAAVLYAGDHPIYHTRQLAILLGDAAVLAHEDQNDRQALDDLHLILDLARIDDQDPAELSHLYATILRAFAAQTLIEHEAELRLSQTDGSAAAAADLLPLMMDNQRAQDARAVAWEASLNLTSASDFRARFPEYWQWWIRPLLTDLAARILRDEARDVPSVRADNYQAGKSLYPARHLRDITYLDEITLVALSASGSSGWYSSTDFQAQSDLAAAALLLAARLYQSQHGHLPAQAADLVPGILPALPVDPYAADHAPMCYRLDPQGPTVWSVGENGIDDHARVLFDPYKATKVRRHGTGSIDPAHIPPDIVYGAAWRTATPPAPPSSAPSSLPLDPISPSFAPATNK